MQLQVAGKAPEEAWSPLCEDLTANLTPGEKPPRPLRPLLQRCLAWPDLWPGEVRDRQAVRAGLEPFDYRPVPINAR